MGKASPARWAQSGIGELFNSRWGYRQACDAEVR